MRLTRRSLLQKLGLLPLAFVFPQWLKAHPFKKKAHKLVILHTNDTHSQIDPLPANHTKYPNQGGVIARAKLIHEYRAANPHVLLFDSGDIFQGTPYFNRFHGTLEMKLMSKLNYDVVTLGNHDFDIGIDGFMNAQQHATFSFVNSNYDFGQTPMADVVRPFQIIDKGPYKVGVFGLGVDLNGLVPQSNFLGIQMKDPYESAKNIIYTLKKAKCNIIICLSHLGHQYEDPSKPSDLLLAKEVSGIDLILGGHTHTFMDEPVLIQNNEGGQVWIHQVGWAGVRLGVIEIEQGRLKIIQKKVSS
jgi:5'-nucleotidase